MNVGAFGENFPYSNFHDLNMDWIIKIAKDFLDQYTHLQETISQGEESIQNLTQEEITALQEKYTKLDGLLQQWYNTHSSDIANQLADALTSLNAQLSTNISAFNASAEQKAQETIATIPADYTKIGTAVGYLVNITPAVHKGFVNDDPKYDTDNSSRYTNPIKLDKGQTVSITAEGYLNMIAMISTCNEDGTLIAVQKQGIDSTKRTYTYTAASDCYVVCSYHVGTDPAEISVFSPTYDTDNLVNNLDRYCVNYVPYLTHEGFFSTTPAYNERGDSHCTSPIKLLKGDTIHLKAKGYLNAISMITKCTEQGSPIAMLKRSIDSTLRTYTYTATEDCYIICSFHDSTSTDLEIFIYSKIYNEYNKTERTTISPTWTTGKYIGPNGRLQDATRVKYSAPIQLLAGETIELYGMGYQNYLAMISITNSNADAYNPVVISGNPIQKPFTYKYHTFENCYVALSTYYELDNNTDIGVTVLKYKENITKEEMKDYYYFKGCFNKVVCIGDSLTEGDQGSQFNPRITPWNYPYYLENATGWDCTNLGESGASTLRWWQDYGNRDYSDFDTAIIFLGTNLGLTDTINTDMADANWENWADTNTGAYGKIIMKLLTDNQNIRIFLVGTYNFEAWYCETTNKVIHKIGTKFSLPVIDTNNKIECVNIFNSTYHKSPLDSHMTSMGYMMFADYIRKNMLYIVNSDPDTYNPAYPNY